jgi:hypothetical protein
MQSKSPSRSSNVVRGYQIDEIVVYLKTKKVKVLFYPMFPDFRKDIAVWFPGVCRSYWYDQHADKDEYGALVE